MVEQAGQLVGDRLALDRLVEVDVLDRDAGLVGEVGEQLALARRRSPAPARATVSMPRIRPPSWARSGCESANEPPSSVSTTSSASSAAASVARDDVAEAIDVALAGDLLEAPGRSRAQRGAAGVGADAVDRRLHDDLEHGVAVEALGERLADAADRLAQARALELQLLEPLLELSRHRVELGAERGELVVALGRDLDREVAAGHPPCRVQQALDLRLQRARDRDREREGRDQRGGEDGDHLERGGAEAAVLTLGEHAHVDAAAVEARAVEAGDAQRAAADLHLARLGQPLGAGVGERRHHEVVVRADHDVRAGDAFDQLRVGLGADRRQRQHTGIAALGVDQARAGRRERIAAPGLEPPGALERHRAAGDALLAGELVEALLDRAALLGLDRLRERLVARDHARGVLRPVLVLAEQPGGGALSLGEPRVGLALLGIGREHEHRPRRPRSSAG